VGGAKCGLKLLRSLWTTPFAETTRNRIQENRGPLYDVFEIVEKSFAFANLNAFLFNHCPSCKFSKLSKIVIDFFCYFCFSVYNSDQK